ncbi:MAG: DUF6305 family protein [Marinisporobacter sp.]|jgi:hypothetical protein|nr:DUF6305 family protein [Marinisporobacter sp.]
MKITRNSKGIVLAIVLCMLSMSLFVGCSGKEESQADQQEAKDQEVTKPVENQEVQENTEVEIKAEQPILITSFGQSADAAMLKAVMGKTEVEFEYNTLATVEDIAKVKTLIVAVGASSKGLGAAGIKPEEELDRAKAIMKAAKENNITVIAAHIGGESRRGDLSDQFINVGINDANCIVVVKSGDQDGLFTNVAKEKNIPISSVENIGKTAETFKQIFSNK